MHFLICGVAISWFFLMLGIYWPGFYSYDSYVYLKDVYEGHTVGCVSGWESYLYSCISYSSIKLSGNLLLTLILQICIAVAVILYGYFVVKRVYSSKMLGIFWSLSMIFFPANALMLIFTERDVIYQWLLMFVAILVLDFLNRTDQSKPKRWLLSIVIVLGVCAAFRREGLFIAILMLLALPWALRESLRWLRWLLLSGSVVIGVFVFLVPFLIAPNSQPRFADRYNVNAFLNPLLEILRDPEAKISSEDQVILNEAIDFEVVNQEVNRGELPMNAIKNTVNGDLFEKLQRTTLKLIFYNFDIFIRNRIWIFQDFVFPEYYRRLFYIQAADIFLEDPSTGKIIDRYWTLPRSINEPLKSRFRSFESESAKGIFRYLIWTPTFGVFSLLVMFLISIKYRSIFYVTLIPVAQLLVAVFTAPVGKLKYIYINYLFFPLALVVVLVFIKDYCRKYLSGANVGVLRVGSVRIPELQSRVKNLKKYLVPIKVVVSICFVVAAILIFGSQMNQLKFGMLPEFGILMPLLCMQLLTTLISSYRWWYLQKSQNAVIPFAKLFAASWISQAIGIVSLGFIGADVFRAFFIRGACQLEAKAILQILFIDRFCAFLGMIAVILGVVGFKYFGPAAALIMFGLTYFMSNRLKVSIYLSSLNHLLKVVTLFYVLNLLQNNLPEWHQNLSGISIGLFLETLPVSIDGFGLGHFSFSELIASGQNVVAYHSYFVVKILFKLLSVTIVFTYFGKKLISNFLNRDNLSRANEEGSR